MIETTVARRARMTAKLARTVKFYKLSCNCGWSLDWVLEREIEDRKTTHRRECPLVK